MITRMSGEEDEDKGVNEEVGTTSAVGPKGDNFVRLEEIGEEEVEEKEKEEKEEEDKEGEEERRRGGG